MEQEMERRIQDYIAGRLSAAEAEAFEAQMFADDALAAEVERALEIRAAMQVPAAASDMVSRRGSARLRPAWALAAGVAALALGLTWVRWQTPPEPVFRGAEQVMGLEAEFIDNKLEAHWAPVAAADKYELRILADDGRLMLTLESETPTAEITLPATGIAGDPTPPAFVEVVALDEFGQTLMRSQRVPLTDAAAR